LKLVDRSGAVLSFSTFSTCSAPAAPRDRRPSSGSATSQYVVSIAPAPARPAGRRGRGAARDGQAGAAAPLRAGAHDGERRRDVVRAPNGTKKRTAQRHTRHNNGPRRAARMPAAA
jgi:hypothetical protein